MTSKEDFGARLREARLRTGLTQQELASRCGITDRALRAIEAGASDPGLSLALALARAVGISVEGGPDGPG